MKLNIHNDQVQIDAIVKSKIETSTILTSNSLSGLNNKSGDLAHNEWLREFGDLHIEDLGGDGHCLYFVLGDALFSTRDSMQELRTQLAMYMRDKEPQYTIGKDDLPTTSPRYKTFADYCNGVESNEWGNNATIQACADLFSVQIQVLSSLNGGSVFPLICPKNSISSNTTTVYIAHYAEFHFVAIRPGVLPSTPVSTPKKSRKPRTLFTPVGATTRSQSKVLNTLKKNLSSPQSEIIMQGYWFSAFQGEFPAKVTPVDKIPTIAWDMCLHFTLYEKEKLDPTLAHTKNSGFSVLFEYKQKSSPNIRRMCADALGQCLSYYIKIENKDRSLADLIKVFSVVTNSAIWWFPVHIVCAHRNNVNPLISPSKVRTKNTILCDAIYNDKSLLPYYENIFRVSDILFSLKTVRQHFLACCQKDVFFKVPVNMNNIYAWFIKFREFVLGDITSVDNNDNDDGVRPQIAAFIACMQAMNIDDVSLQNRNHILYLVGSSGFESIRVVSRENLEAFFAAFKSIDFGMRNKIIQDIDELLGNSFTRRKHGDYYTPVMWVREARRFMDEHIGACWEEFSIVWDASCGTGNLCADRKFTKLFQSTLFAEDISLLCARASNPESHKEAFDFLSGVTNTPKCIDEYCAKRMKEDIASPSVPLTSIVFMNNPPFATGAELSTDTKENVPRKGGVSATEVGKAMKQDGGFRADNVCVQFLYKITKLAEVWSRNVNNDGGGVYNAIFLPTNTWAGSQDCKFLDYYYKKWNFRGGFVFRASEFLGTKSKDWSVSFTVWKFGAPTQGNEVTLSLRDFYANTTTGVASLIHRVGEVQCKYAPTSHLLNCWMKARSTETCTENVACLPLTSALRASKPSTVTKLPRNALGFLVSGTNAIKQNSTQVYLLSSKRPNGHGTIIVRVDACARKEDECVQLLRAVVGFFVRRAVLPSSSNMWKVWHCDYNRPSVENNDQDEYFAWSLNCLVYSLFDVKSSQSAMRGVEYTDTNGVRTLYDVTNHFFFMSRKTLCDVAQKVSFTELYHDVTKSSDEAYVYTLLMHFNKLLNTQSVALLKHMNSLWLDVMPLRKKSKDNGTHLQCWDAGWYQIRALLTNTQHKACKVLHASLRDVLYPRIFKYKFLNKIPSLD